MKIYLLSGPDKYKGYCDILKTDISNEIKNIKCLVGIAANPNKHEKNDKMFFGDGVCPGVVNMLKSCGIEIAEITLLDDRTDTQTAKSTIERADVIYLLGGDPMSQYKFIESLGCVSLLKEFDGIVFGISAGSMNCASNVLYFAEDGSNDIIKYKGLGISSLYIYPHFSVDDEELVYQLKQLSKDAEIFALPNDSYIKITDNKTEIVGKCYLFANEKFMEIN